MDLAREQAARGVPHGALVTASHQTAGRGRRGASWTDLPGDSALMSFVLRPHVPISDVWRISFIASLAGARYLRSIGVDSAQVKWPNDLVIGGKKVGGLLTELVSQAEAELALVLGVGINVQQKSFPEGGRFVLPPTSLGIELGGHGGDCPNARQVIEGFAAELGAAYDAHIFSGAALIDDWRTYQMIGQSQTGVDAASGATVTGVYRDVRPSDGAGIIAAEDGAVLAILPAAS